jgi:hypothetical protein
MSKVTAVVLYNNSQENIIQTKSERMIPRVHGLERLDGYAPKGSPVFVMIGAKEAKEQGEHAFIGVGELSRVRETKNGDWGRVKKCRDWTHTFEITNLRYVNYHYAVRMFPELLSKHTAKNGIHSSRTMKIGKYKFNCL